jgi:hypothetical protein
VNQSIDPYGNERDHLAHTGLTWDDVRARLRKALSDPPTEYRYVQPRTIRAVQPVQMPRAAQPRSFVRWCGRPIAHSAHGPCEGVV